jgi:hypothetical protein
MIPSRQAPGNVATVNVTPSKRFCATTLVVDKTENAITTTPKRYSERNRDLRVMDFLPCSRRQRRLYKYIMLLRPKWAGKESIQKIWPYSQDRA